MHMWVWLATYEYKTGIRIIDCSKQCHFCLWIYLSLHFMLDWKCKQTAFKSTQKLSVLPGVLWTLFSIGASLKYMSIVVMERDWTLSGSLLASCLLQLMEIYILEYNLNIKVYTLHFLLIYIERDREIIFKKIKNPSPLSLCVLIFFCVVKMYVYFYIAKKRHHFYNWVSGELT